MNLFRKMAREKFIMKVLSGEFSASIPMIGKTITSCRPILIATSTALTFGMAADIFEQIKRFRLTIERLVNTLGLITHYGTIFSSVRMRLFGEPCTNSVYSNILEIDSRMKVNFANQTDWTLLMIAGNFFWVVISMLSMVAYVSDKAFYGFGLAFEILCFFDITNVVVMKHLIAKRLKYLRTAEEYMEQVEETIVLTRQLLECNAEVNTTYELLTTTFVTYMFQQFVHSMYLYWAIYGAGLTFDEAFQNNICLSTLFISGRIIPVLLLVVWSSIVADEVCEMKFELNITCTARPCTEKQRKQISLFLMELHNTRAQLTGLGLFDIDKPSFATACVTIISYVLVLIQFT